MAPCTPKAAAPASPPAARAFSTPSGIRVRNGRPWSSSSACAATPMARKKASIVSSHHRTSRTGANAAPIATYDRCHSVYGGCSRVQ